MIVLLIFGPKRLPGLGKGLGQGMREFKEGITGESKDEEDKPAITQARAVPDPSRTPSSAAAERRRTPHPPRAEVGSERRS